MRNLISELKDIKLTIFDLDGVIYRGNTLIPGADTIIQELKDHSIKVVYNSNNSTITRQTYVKRLKDFKIPTKITDFYTSASIAAAEITKLKENASIFVIGEIGLRDELKFEGHRILTNPSMEDIDFVIVGLDREFTYEKLSIAQKCILEGKAQFYATNTDSTLPDARGFKPGAGSMVNSLITCTGQNPIRIFGKPEPLGIKTILNDTQTPTEQTCIFGDRLNTDILAGNQAGILSVVVLTGVTTKDIIESLKLSENGFDKNLIPDLVLNNLSEIFQ
ncbi:MAG: HAD-IIA family hydrolase [Promethearchaeota archaeon]|jgi:4-nitrophenyl phosphatase